MGAFSNVVSGETFTPGVVFIADPEELFALGSFRHGMGIGEYLSLGFPTAALHVVPDSAAGKALAPDLDISGILKFDTRFDRHIGHTLKNYGRMKDSELSSMIEQFLSPEGHYSLAQKEKIASQHDLCMAALRLDREIYRTESAHIVIVYDQRVISAADVRTPFWHRDQDENNNDSREEIENARFIIFRSAHLENPPISAEFIRDSEKLLLPEARKLLEEIESRQNEARERVGTKHVFSDLGGKTYASWKARLIALDLFYQPDNYTGVIYKGQTNHRSHVPEKPTPAGLLRVTVIPSTCS